MRLDLSDRSLGVMFSFMHVANALRNSEASVQTITGLIESSENNFDGQITSVNADSVTLHVADDWNHQLEVEFESQNDNDTQTATAFFNVNEDDTLAVDFFIQQPA